MAKLINRNNTSDMSNLVTEQLKTMNNQSGGAMARFIENAQPMQMHYYAINRAHSMVGKGFKDVSGPYEGAVKYDVIHNYVAYGYIDERGVDVEQGEHLDTRWKLGNLTFLHLPDTIKPLPDDRLSLAAEDHKYLYRVVESKPVTLKNKPFVTTLVQLCPVHPTDFDEESFREKGLIVNTYEYVESNIGTTTSPFMKKEDMDNLNNALDTKDELMELFNDYFYREHNNSYLSSEPKFKNAMAYSPLIVDLQMEFRPLWTFGVNTILHHETVINTRSKYNYKKHILRKFLLRKKGALEELKKNNWRINFSSYLYSADMTQPFYKIGSYFNDGHVYFIYDYNYGTANYQDEEGKVLFTFSMNTEVELPYYMWDIMEAYYNNTINLEELLETIEDLDINFNFEDMLGIFLLLTILDITIKEKQAATKTAAMSITK